MRLKAPAGVGETVVDGTRVKPDKNGIVDVDPQTGAVLMEVFGFADPKAKPSSADQGPSADMDKLRAASLGVLKAFDVVVPAGASVSVLVTALTELPERINANMIEAVKRAETDVAAQSAAIITALTARAEKAEGHVTALTQELAAAAKQGTTTGASKDTAKTGA